MEAIAIISGSRDKLHKHQTYVIPDNPKNKRPAINFSKCGIPIGAELVFIEDDSVRVTVESDRKVLYNNEITSLSAVAGKCKGVRSIAGPSYFTYNGKLITEIAEQTQWKEQ